MRRAVAAVVLAAGLTVLAPVESAEAYRPIRGPQPDLCRNIRGTQTLGAFIYGEVRWHPRAPRRARICVKARRR